MRILFTLLFSLVVLNVEGQFNKIISFDDTTYKNYISLDTVTYHHNSWEVATPYKSIFNGAYSGTKAILTDRLNPYPINDTSVFIFRYKTLDKYPHSNTGFSFSFYYQLDIDSGEIAKVEVSGDTGKTWIDMINEDTTYDFQWFNQKPNLSKSTVNWNWFGAHMDDWVYGRTTYPQIFSADTLLFRFTFISDSIQTNKEGWIIDNLEIHEVFESIEQIQNPNLISLYPNPSDGSFFVKQQAANYSNPSATIYNLQGQVVQKINSIPPNGYISLSLPGSTYLLRYATDKEYTVKRIVIER